MAEDAPTREEFDALAKTVKVLSASLVGVAKDASIYIDRDMDNQSKDILEQLNRRNISENWVSDRFYVFDTLGQPYNINGSGFALLSSLIGLQLAANPAPAQQVEARRIMPYSADVLDFTHRSEFRTDVSFAFGNQVSVGMDNTTAYILNGGLLDGLGYYGFKIVGNSIYGCIYRKTPAAESLTAALTTVVLGVPRTFRAVHTSTLNTDFYIDGIYRASLNGEIGDSHDTMADFAIASTGTPVNISSSTNATPIEITTSSSHGFNTGDSVTIVNHSGNLAANNTQTVQAWVITKVSGTKFTLNGSVGTGVGSGGQVDYARIMIASHFEFNKDRY